MSNRVFLLDGQSSGSTRFLGPRSEIRPEERGSSELMSRWEPSSRLWDETELIR